ncbi:ABC transporter permease [Haloarcula amylolytica]|uniref:ABC transporter integral membrane protein n=1 Tax=Haloarcula amylolytica JCM 13557 TaxID=1227452 RepID=M0K9C7_9EURY|nr:ABC transporter permease [Haloarcula amylolytica]EMA17806.1 ABC transporter integral membrane protein [Haloarcula amylolytica JCM 13557]
MSVDPRTTVLDRLWSPFEGQSGSRRSLLLMSPLILFELLVFVVPFLLLVRISFSEQSQGLPYAEGTFTIASYVQVLQSELLQGIIAYSFKLGIIATLLTVVLAVFYAYATWRASGVQKSALLFSVVLPLLTTLVIKTYVWVPLLAPNGTANSLLLAVSLVQAPLQMVPNTFGVVIGQVYIVFPYAMLAIYSVLTTVEWELVEAARDLGASRTRSFFAVVLPEIMPGITVATVISFAWSVGAYSAPALLGAGSDRPFALEVQEQMLVNFNWPIATALSTVMLVLMFVSILVIYAVLGRFGGDVANAT